MPTLAKYKNTLIAIVSFCLLYLAYVFIWPYFAPEQGVALEQVVTNPTSSQNIEIVQALTNAQSITFDPDFFTSAAYTSLVDYTEEIDPRSESVKRKNPFAPIGK
jgi:hypothetical protein